MTRLERQRIGGEADRTVAQAIADDTAQVVETFACLGADGEKVADSPWRGGGIARRVGEGLMHSRAREYGCLSRAGINPAPTVGMEIRFRSHDELVSLCRLEFASVCHGSRRAGTSGTLRIGSAFRVHRDTAQHQLRAIHRGPSR